MAKSFVSPGVFTSESDVSFLGPGVGAIGAALIGTAPKGPAFVPVSVTSHEEYVSFFGDLDPDHLLGYASRAYLHNSGKANIIRVLGPGDRTSNGVAVDPGYTAESIWTINALTGSSTYALAVLEITSSAALVVNDLTNDEFAIRITGSSLAATDGNIVSLTCSFLTNSSAYIKRVLNSDPTKFATVGYYVRDVHDYAVTKLAGGNAEYTSSSHGVVTNFAFGYNSGSSPWIKSQLFGGATEYNLFRIHTLGHGEAENGRFKVSVRNVKQSAASTVTEFGKFDLEIRSFEDTDKAQVVSDFFPNLSLDPKDPNYIARVIGDKVMRYDNVNSKMVEEGGYENRSRVVRVEMATSVFPDSSLPWGFRGLAKPNLSSGSVASLISELPLVSNLKDKGSQTEGDAGIYWGMETVLSGSVAARFTRYSAMTGSDSDFSLTNVSGSSLETFTYNASNPAASRKSPGDTNSHTVLEPDYAKFTVPIAFGSDGFDRRLSDPVANETQLANISQLGTQALRQAVDIVSDPDFIDINLLVIPGVYSSKVVDYAIVKVQDRADAFYVADISGTTTTAVVQSVKNRNLDTSYAAVYYPEIKIYDDINGAVKVVPASIAAIGAIAYNDRISYAWFAPAGLNRAGLSRDTIGFDFMGVKDQLKQSERDKLYENRINPIAKFPGVDGVIWGQKTLQLKSSALDRINVRRLLIQAKKLIASTIRYLVFEPNNPATQTRFRQLVNPILADIQQKNGLELFKVVFDATTNTPDLVDRNIMSGKILLVPTRAAETILIDFSISRSGATFEGA